jgi:hypothetical protein
MGGETHTQPSLKLGIDDHDGGPVAARVEVVVSHLVADGRFVDAREFGGLGDGEPKGRDRHARVPRHTTMDSHR